MKNKNAGVITTGAKTFDYSGNQKPFSISNFRKNLHFGQCQKCRSDYMRFSVDGYCQDCLQRVEFIRREHPQILQNMNRQGGN